LLFVLYFASAASSSATSFPSLGGVGSGGLVDDDDGG
jgi:hypothetical protein